ncbi:MAG TPA: 23S rRNA (uracil(1939)-C(5))-methyltransferase RlmD [Terriglobales bacterium]|nr:23S rRNA (uracil(1939)-C(5))-methyltransferase RlmD [Terriglobales bacterium]
MNLTIEKLIYGGDGLARLPADERGRRKTVFVPFVLAGEEVEAEAAEQKAEFARARVLRVLQEAAGRIAPKCPYFLRCGGCHYQHASYEHQLEIKAAILKETLARIAKLQLEAELQVHPSPPWNYRNRTRLRVRGAPFALGYYRFGSHALLPVEECPISSPLINRAIAALWQLGRAGKVPAGIGEVELFADSADAQLLVQAYMEKATQPRGAVKEFFPALAQALPEVAGMACFRAEPAAHAPRNQALPQLNSGAGELLYRTGEHEYRVSAGAFFQVNRYLAEELVKIVTAGCQGRAALDLYAGVGLFALPLARSFERVTAVESSQISHSDLQYKCPENVQAVRATTEQHLQSVSETPDLVVVDPPRGGLGQAVAQALGRLRAPRLTYVSCDPATLARDLQGLLAAGYAIEQAHLVDLFPQTFHLETVLHLARK